MSGNLIGTNQDGTGALGNGLHGVFIDSRTNPAMSISITSDEPGAFSPDAAFLEDPAGKMIGLRLRADRKADGDGRVYLIKVTATDKSGNSATMCSALTVPHDQSDASRSSAVAQAAAAVAACEALANNTLVGASKSRK